jgi:hypothetical protein
MPTDSLQVLSKRELICLLRQQERRFDTADLAQWCAGITLRLNCLRKRAREGKCVEEASEFARWLVSSGLTKLFEGTGKRAISTLIADTLYDCECHWKNEPRGPWVAQSELEALNAKLDLVMQRMANQEEFHPRLNETAATGTYASVNEPVLQVITGGLPP